MHRHEERLGFGFGVAGRARLSPFLSPVAAAAAPLSPQPARELDLGGSEVKGRLELVVDRRRLCGRPRQEGGRFVAGAFANVFESDPLRAAAPQ